MTSRDWRDLRWYALGAAIGLLAAHSALAAICVLLPLMYFAEYLDRNFDGG